MRTLKIGTIGLLLVVTLSGWSAGQVRRTSGPVALFEGARLITGDGRAPVERSAFIVANGVVTQVGTAGALHLPPGAVRVDLSGKTVMPALVDDHVHVGYRKGLSFSADNLRGTEIDRPALRTSWAGRVPALSPGPQATAPAAYTDKFVDVNGIRMHYLDWGNPGKPPLVLIHGIARHAHTFDHIAPHFARDYHVLAIDMRGHGDSTWDPEGDYLVEDHVKDLEGLVTQLQLKGITLLGNSTGGRVVQVFAGLHPDLVAKLIVEDVGPERPEDIAAGFARRVQQEANGWANEDELVQQLTKDNPGVAPSWIRTYAHFGVKPRADGRLVWKRDPNLVKGFVPTDLWQYVRRITSPTIYILGGRSTIVPAETQQRLKQTLPHCEIVVMPGLGHYPDVEATADFLAIADRFLRR